MNAIQGEQWCIGSLGAFAGDVRWRFTGNMVFAVQNVPKRCKMWQSFRAATIGLVMLFYVKVKLSQCHCLCLKGVMSFRVIVQCNAEFVDWSIRH